MNEMNKQTKDQKKSCTLEEFVKDATESTESDLEEMRVLIVSHSQFLPSLHFFELLVSRFNANPPENLDEKEKAMWEMTLRANIRKRVGEWLREWVEISWNDFVKDECKVLKEARKFLSEEGTLQDVLIKLKSTYEKWKLEQVRESPSESPLTNLGTLRIAKKQINFDVSTFVSEILPSKEGARQICLHEFLLYSKVQSEELLDQRWNKKDLKFTLAPNVHKVIQRFNTFSQWVAWTIVSQPELKSRISLVVKFTKLAKHSLQLGNLNVCFEILSAFSSSPVRRLKHTFAGLPSKTNAFLADLKEL